MANKPQFTNTCFVEVGIGTRRAFGAILPGLSIWEELQRVLRDGKAVSGNLGEPTCLIPKILQKHFCVTARGELEDFL
jgi:hypothetical protein